MQSVVNVVDVDRLLVPKLRVLHRCAFLRFHGHEVEDVRMVLCTFVRLPTHCTGGRTVVQ